MSALERWAAFLGQISGRHKEIAEESVAAAREALAEGGYDPVPIANAWGGIQTRLQDLEQRIIGTWNEKVQATFEAEAVSRELQNGRAASRGRSSPSSSRTRARPPSTGSSASRGPERMHARALSERKERVCPTCGAPLKVPLTYRAVNLTCEHCRTIATFEPGTLLRNAIAFGAHSLAWEAARPEWLAMRIAERRMKAHRSPTPLASLKEYERAQIAFWRKYCTAKAEMVPEMQDVALEVSSRLDQWYRLSAEHEEEWRNAGRPRERI